MKFRGTAGAIGRDTRVVIVPECRCLNPATSWRRGNPSKLKEEGELLCGQRDMFPRSSIPVDFIVN